VIKLKTRLAEPRILLAPGVYDALTALVAAKAASMHRRAACAISGPMPSPVIRVTLIISQCSEVIRKTV
jgi:hypothetical protein